MWIYIQTVTVYLFVTILMYVIAKRFSSTGNHKYLAYAIAVYSIIFGLRYGVGGDFFTYKLAFQELLNHRTPYYSDNMEQGFILLIKFFSVFGSTSVIFGVIAFIQLYLMVLGLKKEKYVFPLLFLTFMLMGQWLAYSNILRQVISVAIWVYSIKYALDRKIVIHYLLILLAISFHRSAVILLPFYFLINIRGEWFSNIKIQLILLFISIVLMNVNIIQKIIIQTDGLISFLGYSNYVEFYSEKIENETHLGIGFILLLLINIVVILYSNKVKKSVNNLYYTVLYNFFFIGVLFNYIFINSQLLTRFNYYFNSYTFIFIAFTLYYLKIYNKKWYSILFSFVILTFIALIYKADENWSLFVFEGQSEYYYLHNGHMKH